MIAPKLSKSRIQSGRQCTKRLWLELHQRDTAQWGAAAQARLDEGTRFGELAQQLLGGGLLIDADHLHAREALEQTRAALARPIATVPMLFEPAFEHEDVRVRVDAFRRDADGDTLIEVKSTTSVKDEHIWDCAIQAWVARGAGRNVRRVVLAHIDRDFVYTTTGDYSGLLVQVDITAEVDARQAAIPDLVARLNLVAREPMPAIGTGPHCSTPYGCPFLGHCQSSEPPLPEYPIELLPRGGALIEHLRSQGYRDIREVPEGLLTKPLFQVIAAATRNDAAFVSAGFADELNAIPYPRWFLDFETISPVIPRWLGTRPFQPLPFQFSCHRESIPGVVTHAEFLDLSGESPLAAFVDRLIDAVDGEGPIVVWNQGFEASRLRELATMFPDSASKLLQIIERMVDLLPLYRRNYYHRDMRGSWSLKAVLPTIAPELAYTDLDVGGGLQAQVVYAEAVDPATTAIRREELRRQLLLYCARDTEALLRLMRVEAPIVGHSLSAPTPHA